MVTNYLDLFGLYKIESKENKRLQRKILNRDFSMKRALIKQKYLCFYCADDINMSGHLDHVIPVYYGGKSVTENLVATCRECNILKGTQQLIITNRNTISFYENLKREHRLWIVQCRKFGRIKKSNTARLYYFYHADRFRGRQT